MRARSIRLVTGAVFVLAACTSSSTDDATEATADSAAPEVVERTEWGEVFAAAGVVGTFAVREAGSGQTLVWNPERAAVERLPASTFKILNSMVILETGVLPDVEAVVAWDGVERDVDAWNRDHSLRSGIEVSAVWMYQALAREVGEERMAALVEAAEYGNADIGGGIDRFWLRGDLRISALGQLDFLEDMVEGDLPFRTEVVDQVRDIIVRESGAGWVWSHKTGTALSEDPDLGWLVGSTEHDGRTWLFALNVDLAPVTDLGTEIDPFVRQTIARELLVSAGALPG